LKKNAQLITYRGEEIELDEETKREAQGKRVVIDKQTGKPKEVDIYDRPEPAKKKADPERQRANLSSNLEQSLIPADISKSTSSFEIRFLPTCVFRGKS
jgi:hypothetical protein